jgi:hypothetical protein
MRVLPSRHFQRARSPNVNYVTALSRSVWQCDQGWSGQRIPPRSGQRKRARRPSLGRWVLGIFVLRLRRLGSVILWKPSAIISLLRPMHLDGKETTVELKAVRERTISDITAVVIHFISPAGSNHAFMRPPVPKASHRARSQRSGRKPAGTSMPRGYPRGRRQREPYQLTICCTERTLRDGLARNRQPKRRWQR